LRSAEEKAPHEEIVAGDGAGIAEGVRAVVVAVGNLDRGRLAVFAGNEAQARNGLGGFCGRVFGGGIRGAFDKAAQLRLFIFAGQFLPGFCRRFPLIKSNQCFLSTAIFFSSCIIGYLRFCIFAYNRFWLSLNLL
jgi:hypothetical protein